MEEFRDKLDRIHSSLDERDKRLAEILAAEDDLISLVLRGHLVMEELLFSAVAAHCQNAAHLKAANLRFPQVVALLRALEKLPAIPNWLWTALSELNALRNSLAHRIESPNLTEKVANFLNTVPMGETYAKVPKPTDQKALVKNALHYMFGSMTVAAVFQSVFEELIRQNLTDHAKQQRGDA